MRPSGVIWSLLLLFPTILAQDSIENVYLLAITSQTVGGTTETLCVTINPEGYISLVVTLTCNQTSVELLRRNLVTSDFYTCVQFQVPMVSQATVASIKIQITGLDTFQEKETKFLITPPSELIIIETDKPIYKPGQTVKFRIVSLTTNFFTYNQKFPTIALQNPNSNRIGQWLNVSTSSGLVDLSFPLSSEAMIGTYKITVYDQDKNTLTEDFDVKNYVLPTFEVTVTLPSTISIVDTYATLKVCAKYTYGKPVNGMVRATVCRKCYRYWWRPVTLGIADICKKYNVMTDQTGCGVIYLNLVDFALTDSRYENSIQAECEVEESGTGVILTGSATAFITPNMVTITFEDSLTVFKLGLPYDGKIKVIDPNSNPLKNKKVYLTVRYTGSNSVQELITNDEGIATFSTDTEPWGLNSVTLEAQYESINRPSVHMENQLTPYYPTAYLYLQPFYSQSQSFIKLLRNPEPFICTKNGIINAKYVIQQSALSPSQTTLYFYYMVMSKGQLVQQGRIKQTLIYGPAVYKGNLMVTLQKMAKLTPVAQVVIYAILSNGEAVADSRNYPVKPCLTNKVSLKFASSTELPGDVTTLTLLAAPGSLCSVKAIDQSLLLLKPEKEITIDSVFNMLPVQALSGYPYKVSDEDNNPCWVKPFWGIPEPFERSIAYYPNNEKLDVYNTFKDVGIKILTNANVKKPLECMNFMTTSNMMAEDAMLMPMIMMAKQPMEADFVAATSPSPVGNQAPGPIVTVRKVFPETWIFDLVPVSLSGNMTVTKTVPDSITTWQANAFCTSPVGFGVAPKTQLIAFQPFFVSIIMPISVIRGEMFTLKATVFNYLQTCMMVKVTLAFSNDFSVRKCTDCIYTLCLCANESWTFSWTITPRTLGWIKFNVTAEAVVTSGLCGGKAVTVPKKGRIDTIIKTLLVQAEGTKQIKTYNELLCPSGVITKTVALTLPPVYVSGSASASVSVLGDLMGRALQNLASLLAMPSGCGEQNMLNFAPNIYILQYLQSTSQLTPEIRSTAQNYLITGYQRELTFKHTDGSYSAFGMTDPSGNTWLTAFVMKCFGSAMSYIFVDQAFVDQAKLWLGQQQQSNGCFASVGRLIHTNMQGGANDEATLAAYITAAMLELSFTGPVVDNSLTCLRNAYSQVTSTYAKALLFYTFTLAGDQGIRTSLMSALNAVAIVSGTGRYWSRATVGSPPDSLEIEMTSYVLLGLMSGPELPGFGLGYSTSIVQWLSQQQNAFGGFASTQDTVVALQALAKYSQATYRPAGRVNVIVTSPSGLTNAFTINQSNRMLYQERQLQEVPGNYRVKAIGEGCVYVQFSLSYNIPPPPGLSSFIITASATGNCRVPNPTLTLTITLTYSGPRLQTNMVIIEVKPLSGFSVDVTTVQLSAGNLNSTNGAVNQVGQNDGKTVIYLNGLIQGEQKVYTMTLVQDLSVENLQAAIVKVYDYYETTESAVTDYTSPCPTQRPQ